jgi:hypothetical protein
MAEATGKGPGDQVRVWAGHRLDEIGGEGVGKVDGVFVDEPTGKAELEKRPADAITARPVEA